MNIKQKEIRIMPGDPEILGANILAEGINFAVVVPEEQEASLVLVFKEEEIEIPLPVENRVGEISAVCLKGITSKTFGYYFVIQGDKVIDPFAACIRDGLCYLDQRNYNWQNDTPINRPLEEMMIYQLHVRGFTKKRGSGVSHRGTFRGVMEKIPYIKSLGFNTVQLLPIYEWDDTLQELPPYAKAEPEGAGVEDAVFPRNYWGYAKKNYYYAPKQAFSSIKDSVRELKDLIRELHREGIEVIMELYFPPKTWPQDAERTVRYWKKQYHIDGFRLIGEGVPMESLIRDPLLKTTKMFFDHVDTNWVYGSHPPKKRHLVECGYSFLEGGRCFLKGDEGKVLPFAELMRRNPKEIGVLNFMAGINGFTLYDSVSYDWKHNEANGEDNLDGPTLNYSWNCGAEGTTRKKSVLRLRARQERNALVYLFLSQGIPLLLAGDEAGNSQKGNNNAYSSDNEIGWLDWSRSSTDLALTDFVSKLTAFRREHPILRQKEALRGIDYKNIGFPDVSYHDEKAWVTSFHYASRTLGLMYCGLYAENEAGQTDDFIYMAMNAHWEDHEFGLPTLPAGYVWQIAIDTGAQEGEEFTPIALENAAKDQRIIEVTARSVVVLVGRKYPELLTRKNGSGKRAKGKKKKGISEKKIILEGTKALKGDPENTERLS